MTFKSKEKSKPETRRSLKPLLYSWIVALNVAVLILLLLLTPGLAGTAVFGGKNLGQYVNNIYSFSLGAIAIAAVMMIIIGGFFYTTSAGNTDRAATGRDMIVSALLGLFVALTAYLFLTMAAGKQFVEFGTGEIGKEGSLNPTGGTTGSGGTKEP